MMKTWAYVNIIRTGKKSDLEDYILIKPNIFGDTYNSERKKDY